MNHFLRQDDGTLMTRPGFLNSYWFSLSPMGSGCPKVIGEPTATVFPNHVDEPSDCVT